MNKKTFLPTIALVIFSMFAVSCSNEDDPGEPQIIQGFVRDFSLQQLNNGGSHPSFSSNNKFPKDSYMLVISMSLDASAWGSGRRRVVVDLADPIVSIDIFSIHAFNDAYPAGSDITGLFRQYPLSLEAALHDYTEEGREIVRMDFHNGHYYKALLTPPNPGTHQFRVEMSFKSGEKIIKETEPIEII